MEHVSEEAADQKKRQLFTDFYECRKKLLASDDGLQDILARQDEQLSFKASAERRRSQSARRSHLQVKNLFCIGSPLGVFIIMRGTTKSVVPMQTECGHLYNIFHPYDPVAYRLVS